MEQVRTTDWMQRVPKILKAGAVLAIISVVVPSIHAFESVGGYSLTFFIWFFGYYWLSFAGETETGFIDEVPILGEDIMTFGILATVLLIFACILMGVGSYYAKDERDNKITAGTGLLGGILALIAPAIFYFGIKEEIPGFWGAGGFDPSIGVYLPIIAGILGILCAIAAGYAFTLESQREPVEITPLKPAPDRLAMDKEPEVANQQESPTFCKNCGTKLVGEFCQECGQKAEF